MTAKFELGKIVQTPGALEALERSGQDAEFFAEMHAQGCWGDVAPDDQAENERALRRRRALGQPFYDPERRCSPCHHRSRPLHHDDLDARRVLGPFHARHCRKLKSIKPPMRRTNLTVQAGRTTMLSQAEIRQQITQKIVEAFKRGVVPWRRPWRSNSNSGTPSNAVSSKAYRGINILLLGLAALEHGYESRFWHRQWQTLGGQVRRGEHGTKEIVFYRPVVRRVMVDENGEERVDSFPILPHLDSVQRGEGRGRCSRAVS